MSLLAGLVAALLVAGALAALSRSGITSGITSGIGRQPRSRAGASASTPSVLGGLAPQRFAVGAVVLVLVLLANRWMVLAIAAAALVVLWGRILRDQRADDERRRIEGIAKWLEGLRDTLRSSSMGAEEALEHVASRPPDSIADALTTFATRRRQGFRTEDALVDLADALRHPTADAAVAAIRLVIGGSAGAGRLYGTVDALAAAARDEVTARERVDRTRAVYQHSMNRLVAIGAGLVAYLHVAGGDLLDPYDTPSGQLALLLPLAMWAGCIGWLRSLCRYDLPERHRTEADLAQTTGAAR
ncbi:MAG: type II secretion system F family protein [Ilumatobacteraceae bacterium]